MSYKLQKPYTDNQKVDFIVKYNHEQGLRIYETEAAIFALEKNEIMQINDSGYEVPVVNENYSKEQAQKQEVQFKKDFFETSLGWVRRKVSMQDGSVKDFLSDLLLSIKAGIEMGQNVEIITYKKPDFETEINNEYLISLQQKVFATSDFVVECLNQTVKDFGG